VRGLEPVETGGLEPRRDPQILSEPIKKARPPGAKIRRPGSNCRTIRRSLDLKAPEHQAREQVRRSGPKSRSGKSAVSPLVSHGLLANRRFRAANFSENLSRHLDCCLSG
jgi:hypothetical protein